MKNIFKKISDAVWIYIIVTACCLFVLNFAFVNSLCKVRGTDLQQVSDYSDQSFNESGAFGDWEEFSDFYEETVTVRPDSAPSEDSHDVSEEISSESILVEETSSSQEIENSSQEIENSSQGGIEITPVIPSESSETVIKPEVSSGIQIEPQLPSTPSLESNDSPFDAPDVE